MLHADDALLSAGAQIHCAAHAGHLLAGDDPVSQVTLHINFQSAQEASVHMAAADQAEVGGGIGEGAIESHAGGSAAGIGHMVRHIVGVALLGVSAGTDDTQLGMDDQLNALGQVAGDHGGQADTQVDHVAVLQFFCTTLGNKAFDLRLIHYFFSPSTM